MASNPIGITFMPNDEASAQGPRRGNLEGLTEQVFKLLSLRLPRVVGAQSLAPQGLLQGQGAGGAAGAGGFNPNAAVFEAMLRAMGRSPSPNVTPGIGPGDRPQFPPAPPMPTNTDDIRDRFPGSSSGQLPTNAGGVPQMPGGIRAGGAMSPFPPRRRF